MGEAIWADGTRGRGESSITRERDEDGNQILL